MVYLYKNFLVVDRNDTNAQIVHMMNSINVGFTDGDNVWHIKSNQDKIIFVFGSVLASGDTIHTNGSIKPDMKPIGYIKIYCQGSKVKVSEINFRNEGEAKAYLRMFKGYLRSSIKSIGFSAAQIDAEKFVLYWSKVMYNADVEKILKEIGLVSDFVKRTYTFTSSVVLDQPPPTSFGAFNTNPVSTWPASTPFGA